MKFFCYGVPFVMEFLRFLFSVCLLSCLFCFLFFFCSGFLRYGGFSLWGSFVTAVVRYGGSS